MKQNSRNSRISVAAPASVDVPDTASAVRDPDRFSNQQRSTLVSNVAQPQSWQRAWLLLVVVMPVGYLGSELQRPETPLLLLLVPLVLILTPKYWTAAIFLFIVQADLFFATESGTLRNAPATVAFFAMVVIAAISRYRTLNERCPTSVIAGIRQLRGRSDAGDGDSARSLQTLVIGAVVRLAATIGICLFASYRLLSLLPALEGRFDQPLSRWLLLRPDGYRVLAGGLFLFLCFLPFWLVINELFWRTLSAAQASLLLRATFVNWMHRDLRLIVKKRLRLRRRRLRKSGNITPAATAPGQDLDT